MKPTIQGKRKLSLSQQSKKGYKQTQIYSKSEPDIYVILQHKIYPLHKAQISRSQFITRNIKEDQMVIILPFKIQDQHFERVLNYFYGQQLTLQTNSECQNLYNTVKVLEIQELVTRIEEDFKANFDQYSFFNLYKISINYNLNWLLSKCNDELKSLQYQQININKFDLFQLPKQIFENVIRNHQRMKASKQITGLSRLQIKETIQEYSEHNKLSICAQQLLQVCSSDFQIQSKSISLDKSMQDKVLRSQKIIQRTLSQILQLNKQHNKSCIEFGQLSHEQIIKEVLNLKVVNEALGKKSFELHEQIKQLKSGLACSKQTLNLDEIEKRIKIYTQMYASFRNQSKANSSSNSKSNSNSDNSCNSNQKQYKKDSIHQIAVVVHDETQLVKEDQQKDISHKFLCKSEKLEDQSGIKMSIEEYDYQYQSQAIKQDEINAINEKIGISLQTTNPSLSQTQISSISFSQIPKMERDFTF